MKKLTLLILLCLSSTAMTCEPSKLLLKSTDPINGKVFELHLMTYIAEEANDKQVIILPPTGGVSTLEKKYASKICDRGVSAFVFENWTAGTDERAEDLYVHNRNILRGIHAVQTFLDYSNIPTRVMGTSLGGMYAGVVTGKFSQIKKAVIIASGTNLSQVLATSSLPAIVEQREKRISIFSLEGEHEYGRVIKETLEVEAETFRDGFAGKKLLFFQTSNDTVIRPRFQKELVDLFESKNTKVQSNFLGHKSGIIWTYARHRQEIVNFLTTK